jgi:hypothetical protein
MRNEKTGGSNYVLPIFFATRCRGLCLAFPSVALVLCSSKTIHSLLAHHAAAPIHTQTTRHIPFPLPFPSILSRYHSLEAPDLNKGALAGVWRVAEARVHQKQK